MPWYNPAMPERFFVDGEIFAGSEAVIEGLVASHIARSLRMRAGDTLVAVDGAGREHGLSLTRVEADRVEGEVTWSREATGEPRLRITVLQALPRERMEDCIDALVQAGATEIRPVITERVVSRPGEDRIPPRLRRWQAVAAESAQLAGRGMIPRVHSPTTLDDALVAVGSGSRLISCTFDGEPSIVDLSVDAERPLTLCIGPEGGLGTRDLDILRANGTEAVHIGARVLRTRYAGAIACALLLGRSGDLATPLATEPPLT